MGKVILTSTVSLDGFIADRHDRVGPLFDWYSSGDTPIGVGNAPSDFRVSRVSAHYVAEAWSRVGAAIIGRHLFDLTNGWNGQPVVGDRVFVVTHRAPTEWPYPEAPFTFVTDGVASAVAQAKEVAGPNRDVAVNAGDVGGQVFEAGLVDEVDLALAPVVLGSGVRFFGNFDKGPALLEDPVVVEGERVLHLRYKVRKD